MYLPKIPSSQLTPELREIVGDADIEFDPIVDESDVFDIQVDPDSYYEKRLAVGNMLIESRHQLDRNTVNEVQRHDTRCKENN